MEDRNKGLPLIVSEILIEMHEMRGDIRQLAGSIHTMIDENRKNTEMMVSVLNRYADMMNRRLDDHDDRIITLENK